MKKIKFIIVLLAGLFMIPSFAQVQSTNDEVTLVVSADGATKEEATKVALRSAIEQAYGTFVSANTTILNDELVKDEIVTVSQGNIKSYQEIASERTPDGKNFVTLRATVCISKLVSYAKSKGATVEFAGNSFAMDIRLKSMNTNNEIIAMKNLTAQVEKMIPNSLDFNLNVSEPKTSNGVGVDLTFTISVQENGNMEKIKGLILKTIMCLAMNKEEIDEYNHVGLGYCPFYICNLFGLTDKKRVEYWWWKSRKIDPKLFDEHKRDRTYQGLPTPLPTYALRSCEHNNLFEKANNILYDALTKFEIVDNTGAVSLFEDRQNLKDGTNIFKKIVKVRKSDDFSKIESNSRHLTYNWPYSSYFIPCNMEICKIELYIPVRELAKYSKFEIRKRNI